MKLKKIKELYELFRLNMIIKEEQVEEYFDFGVDKEDCLHCGGKLLYKKIRFFKFDGRCNKCCRKKKKIFFKKGFVTKNVIEILKFLFYFAVDINPQAIVELSGINEKKIYKFLKNILKQILHYEALISVPIGGNESIVQIDEMHLGKRKFNRGRLPNQKIVFGGICMFTKRFFMEIVRGKTTEVLGAKIIKHIKPGTTIFSDQWSSYISFFKNNTQYYHSYVNHQINFMEPISGTNTQMIESLWADFKRFKRRKLYSKQSKTVYYINEFKMRKRIVFENKSKADLFEHLINLILN